MIAVNLRSGFSRAFSEQVFPFNKPSRKVDFSYRAGQSGVLKVSSLVPEPLLLTEFPSWTAGRQSNQTIFSHLRF